MKAENSLAHQLGTVDTTFPISRGPALVTIAAVVGFLVAWSYGGKD